MTTLTTERLTLRPFRADDAQEHYDCLVSRPEAMRFLPGGVPGTPADSERITTFFAEHWERRGYGVWAVCDATGAMLGQCGLNDVAQRDCVEVLYAFAPEHWGHGYATESGEAAVRYGFETVGLPALCGYVVAKNTASVRVLEKLGMTRQGPLEIFGLMADEYRLDRSDWPSP